MQNQLTIVQESPHYNLSLFGGEIIFEVFRTMWLAYLNVTDGQTDGQYTVE